MSNFDFLQSEWNDIYELAKEAENCIWSKPVYACLTNRKALEKAVIWMYKNDEDLTFPYDKTNLNSLLHEETFINAILPVLVPKVNLVKKLGNIAAHDDKKLSNQDALQSSMELFHFLYWFYRCYSIAEPTQGLKFDSAIIPKTTPDKQKLND